MGSYREYMRSEYPEARTSVLTWLLCSVVAGYVLQMTLLLFFHGEALVGLAELSSGGLRHWHLWSLVSYAFLHSPVSPFHLLFSLLTLYFIGREVHPEIGSAKFLWVYGLSAVVGGLFFCGVHWNHPYESVVGASAALTGLFIVFACLHPDRQITTLFLFFPVTFPKTKYLAFCLVGFDVLCLAFGEIGKAFPTPASSAHLGGAIAGFIYFKCFLSAYPWRLRLPQPRSRVQRTQPAWLARARQTHLDTAKFEVNIVDRAHLRAEVDRILDKINSHGFASLTPEEKKTLDEAKDLLSKN